MSQPNTRHCTHIKVNGIPCGSPALRGERFCYYHQRAIRGVRTPPRSRLHPIALIEDPQSLQFTLMEVINALLRDTIDIKRAGLILRALHIAVKNMQNPNYVTLTNATNLHDEKIVKEIPDYPAPDTAEDVETAHVGTGAPARPGAAAAASLARHSCDIPLTAAYPPAPDTDTYARRHYDEVLQQAHAGTAHVGSPAFARPAAAAAASTQPKPPTSVREVPATKPKSKSAHAG